MEALATHGCSTCGALTDVLAELPAGRAEEFTRHAGQCDTCGAVARYLGTAILETTERSDESRREMRDYVVRELERWSADHRGRMTA